MINKKISYLILAVVLISGISFFWCEQFGSGGDINNMLYGKWTPADLPDGINLSVSFRVGGSFNLNVSTDVAVLLELIEGGFPGDQPNEQMWEYDEINIADLINVKTLTFEIRGTYSDYDSIISVTPTEIRSNAFTVVISAFRKIYGEYYYQILDMVFGGTEESALIRKVLDMININDILSELNKNLSGWVGTPQLKTILNYSYNRINSLLITKLAELGITEKDLEGYLGGEDDDEGLYFQTLSEPEISEDLMIAVMLYSVKISLKEVVDNADEMFDSLFSQIIPPFEYDLEDGFLSLYGMTFTR